MNVLRAFLQLREGGEGVAGLGVAGVVHFHQDRAVALHDQRIGGIVVHSQPRGSAVCQRGENGSVVGSAKAIKAGLSLGNGVRRRKAFT